MDRRGVLRRMAAASSGLAAALAGCSTSQRAGTPGPTATPAESAVPSTTSRPPTPSDPTAAFELLSIDSPSTVAIGAPFRFGFTVRNTTDKALTFSTRWSFRTPHAEWREQSWVTLDIPITFPVPAGEARSWRSAATDFHNMAHYEFRLDLFGTTWSVDSVAATRRFGEPFETLDLTVLTVEGLEVWPEPGGTGEGAISVGHGDRLARAYVRVRNLTRHTMPHDEPADLVLAADGRVIEPTPRPGDARAVLARPGGVTEGWVAFGLPRGTALDGAAVSWRPAHFDGPVRVDWTAPG